MSLIREYEILIDQVEAQIDIKARRVVRIQHEVHQLEAEHKVLSDDIRIKETLLSKLRKEQWKEEDKVINKLKK